MKKTVETAFLALGANLGDRRATLRGAREALQDAALRVAASSPLYETEPVGGPEGQSPFLNAVLQVETTLSPEELLERCLAVENRFGRVRRELWGPRTLDVDLLLYGGEILRSPRLILPHPRLHDRPFVLCPLCDLDTGLLHPLLGVTVGSLAASLPQDGVRRLSAEW